MDPLLQINELSRKFGDVCVLNRLSLSVQRGEIFGLLGLNGAGKTTLFKCILKLIKSDGGSILYDKQPLEMPVIHEKIGYLPEFYLPPGELKASEYLRLLGMAVSGPKPDVDALLKKTDLDPHKLIGDYSRGMIQRLGLAIALLKSPEFIILDEPTLGLDPLVRLRLLDWLRELNAQGKTILLSSHDFAQVEKVCQRIAVLHEHQLRYIGPIAEFLEQHAVSSLEDAFLKEIGGPNA
ncbi:MAG: ABC transporter ATP-binding protein [Candidatus Riflebacteria bacterium HGW-Riflebacteria-2]|jgi:ABC-2 type transport system ATP-binding protein|nr:MAG: ABC transporter ATP-binding protein [Candidatus Riflebacteria bacterium HGW-Riflebacteria-2]